MRRRYLHLSATDPVSLNEEVLRNEIAEEVCLRDKGDSDRITASAHDRIKYYRPMLADVDKPELKLIQTSVKASFLAIEKRRSNSVEICSMR